MSSNTWCLRETSPNQNTQDSTAQWGRLRGPGHRWLRGLAPKAVSNAQAWPGTLPRGRLQCHSHSRRAFAHFHDFPPSRSCHFFLCFSDFPQFRGQSLPTRRLPPWHPVWTRQRIIERRGGSVEAPCGAAGRVLGARERGIAEDRGLPAGHGCLRSSTWPAGLDGWGKGHENPEQCGAPAGCSYISGGAFTVFGQPECFNSDHPRRQRCEDAWLGHLAVREAALHSLPLITCIDFTQNNLSRVALLLALQ